MASGRSEKYVISLDAVDINILSTNFKSKYDYVPLWSVNSKESDYYEFEIKNVDNDNDDEIPNITCHICNIQVPKPYLKQHHNSSKHKINLKIAETALERLKNNMHNHMYSNVEINPSLHFCASCVAVIKMKDKIKHEKSHAHKNSLMIDKVLNDFYVLYTDYEIGHNDLTSKPNDVKNDLSCDIAFISATDNDSSVLSKDVSIGSGKISESATTDSNNENKLDNKVDSASDKRKKKAKADKEKSTPETSHVETINDKIKESITDAENEDNADDGFIIKTNKKRKSKSKADKEISNTVPKTKETQNKIENVTTHIVDAKLIARNDTTVAKTTQFTKKAIKIKVSEKNICEMCNNKNGDHNLCEFLAEELNNNYSDIPKICDVIKDLQYHLVMRSDAPFCMVCNYNCMFVDVIAHLFSDDHFNKYERVVEENFLLSEGDFTKCLACNVKVKKELELLHCEDMTHITKQEMFKKKLKK